MEEWRFSQVCSVSTQRIAGNLSVFGGSTMLEEAVLLKQSQNLRGAYSPEVDAETNLAGHGLSWITPESQI